MRPSFDEMAGGKELPGSERALPQNLPRALERQGPRRPVGVRARVAGMFLTRPRKV